MLIVVNAGDEAVTLRLAAPEVAGGRLRAVPAAPSDEPRSIIVDSNGDVEIQLGQRTGLVLRGEPAS